MSTVGRGIDEFCTERYMSNVWREVYEYCKERYMSTVRSGI